MKTFKLKRVVALLVSAIAMFIANMSSSMCAFFFLEEEEKPKSLHKR